MNREIKFRAWDKRKKEMIGDIQDACDVSPELTGGMPSFYSFLLYPNDYEIMQYTGLNDKNGNEIYEDDVIRDHFPKPKLWRIKFGNHDTCSGDCESSFAYGWYGQCGEDTHELEGLIKYLTDGRVGAEIVGNIFENLEYKDMT